MTAIKPTESDLRDKINADSYNSILNDINAKYTEMDKYISNLQSDILSIKDFESEMIGEFDGEETVGIETFRLLYEKMGFKKSVAFSRLPIIRNAFNAGYYVFAYWIRPYLPKKSSWGA